MWKGTPMLLQVGGQHVGRKAGLLLVEVDGDDVEADRRALAQAQQDVQQRVAVLAARQADHDLVAGLDHVEVGDRLAHLAVQALAELVGFEGGLGGNAGLQQATAVEPASLAVPPRGEAAAGRFGGDVISTRPRRPSSAPGR
jgi:hypothetical protein